METRYIRNLKGSYIITPRIGQEQPWEKEMLSYHQLEHLLVPEEISENGEAALWYDISGKQALDVILEVKEIDYDLFANLCTALITMAEQLEELLLVPDVLLLRPDCIFLDNRDDTIWFCYYPGNPMELKDAFHELIQTLLRKLDHRDKRAAEAVYLLYEETGKEGYSFENVMKILCAQDFLVEENVSPEWEESMEEEVQPLSENEKPIVAGKGKWNRDFFLQLKEWILGKLQRKKSRIPSREKNELLVFEPENESEEHTAHPTVLLSELTKKPQGILKYEGTGNGRDLQIEGDSYIIGSDDACDGRIADRTVSRCHARVTKVDDIYFIEDLNSSNGTYVGGELLNCRVKMSLQPGEVVMFAGEKFRFI